MKASRILDLPSSARISQEQLAIARYGALPLPSESCGAMPPCSATRLRFAEHGPSGAAVGTAAPGMTWNDAAKPEEPTEQQERREVPELFTRRGDAETDAVATSPAGA